MQNFAMKERLFFHTSRTFAFFVLIILVGIFITLFIQALPAIKTFGFSFLITSDWSPNKEIFGGAAAIYGSVIGTILAMIFAIPLSLGIAIFLSEICPKKLKTFISSAIELLAAIPSIVYGMWGLFYLTPFLGKVFGGMGIGILSAAIILSIMILPFMSSITQEGMQTTPNILKESAYALGATKVEVIKDVILPHIKVGVIGGMILALGRALGETMAVTFVIGNSHKITSSLLLPATNIPATLANEFAEADSDLYYSSLFYLALILFSLSLFVITTAKFYLIKKTKKGKIR
ncbi:phosphate ABC transporter permease subunit PstC [Helicobacter cappadocius]|uniref:Phosphate transport system permease protein n=1 Tax=Helicobacter cappadocius TaxID=3063998 RepID=A0AA90ST20_9HELI|nr:MULTISPECIES: phosphate ABC transporter permease subunit PstC [unclassified Helicobacter]MDO7253611.1 phosphate ABC transporter permease subunit PstC [Helicobacter sp. faydin-H75]MDP2539539.1 phosphate ABC transporter permease subunit PstC [Helicobacter sp. faydin-H76]